MNILNKNPLILLGLLIVIVSIPITIYLVQKQQIFKGQATTKSKLSIQTSWERVQGDAVMNFIETAQPVVVKLLSGYNRATEIKQKSSGTFIVGRIYDDYYDDENIYDKFVLPGLNPESKAQDWVSGKSGTISGNPSIDCWEGPNEPAIFNDQAMSWYSRFEKKRVELLATMGRRACIGNFSTGNPGDINLWPYFYEAIRTAKNNNGYLALHEYSAPYMNCDFANPGDPSDEGWHTGRYRKLYRNYLAPNGLGDTRLIITETGIDWGSCSQNEQRTPQCRCSPREGNQANGWRPDKDANTYVNELKWYDSILQQDSYVVGATIFIYGRSDWDSFEIYPELTGSDGRTGPLTTYIRGAPGPTPTPGPTATPTPPSQSLSYSCGPPIRLSASWNRGAGSNCNIYIQAGTCAYPIAVGGTSCTGTWSGTALPNPPQSCATGLWHGWAGSLNHDTTQLATTTINCPSATPTPTPPAQSCSVSWTLSNSTPAPNTNINVTVYGLSDPGGWQNIDLWRDNTDACPGAPCSLSIQQNPLRFIYSNVNSGSSGSHTLKFTVNNGTRTCTPTKTFTTSGGLPEDVNRDGCLSNLDFNEWLYAYTHNGTPRLPQFRPNINGDGVVDLRDFNQWWGAMSRREHLCSSPTPTPVPTPTPGGAPACAPAQVTTGVSPNPGRVGQNMTFTVSGTQGSTWIGDSWSGGVNCTGSFWGSKTCSATTAGTNFTWTHTWKNCAPSNCNITSPQCSKQATYSIAASTPTPIPTPTPTPTPIPRPTVTPTPTPPTERALHISANMSASGATPGSSITLRARVTNQAGLPIPGAAVTFIVRFPCVEHADIAPNTNADGRTEKSFIVREEGGWCPPLIPETVILVDVWGIYSDMMDTTQTSFRIL